ncbi:MAG: NAD(+) synthase [Lachnospiraceae bacterium]|nr:NAD(+) synthase [Lachnospiraceae bacterium]
MKYGYVKVAAATCDIKVGDVTFNADKIIENIDKALEKKVEAVVFPELSLTGYTCSDLFWQTEMLNKVYEEIIRIAKHTLGKNIVAIVGIPFEALGKLYNCAAIITNGKVIGLVPKKNLPNYSEFYEARHFTPGFKDALKVTFPGQNEEVLMGMNIIFKDKNMSSFTFAVEICEDLWVPKAPSVNHALAGANIIFNLSASDEITGKSSYRRELVSSQAARLVCGYVYADAGEGESTTDLVFAGHNIIAENGRILKESERFKNEMIIADIDMDRIVNERRKMTTYSPNPEKYIYSKVEFEIQENECVLEDKIFQNPFVPDNMDKRNERCNEILTIQSMGLKKRIAHTNAKSVVVGISGGLDSTLALLVAVRAMDALKRDRKDILAVTMPGFGTTDRTYDNAVTLIKNLGATFMEISIKDAATKHYEDIGHDINVHDVTYENVQARQRTLYLMNLANEHGGFVIGTGDLSELALGWATYNGDHMSMYGVNASIPKTLVRHLVKYYADTCGNEELEKTLLDVLDTPVSPELLPPKENGNISQKTEDLVGPYELHDFFMYYMLRLGYGPEKIFFLANNAFSEKYDKATIYKWLRNFYYRFFAQQFKRSCLPDGPKVGTVAVSPRGDLRMPSDACARLWIERLEKIWDCKS